MQSMVEGQVRHGPTSRRCALRPVPLHHLSGGPPPRSGEDRTGHRPRAEA